MGAGSSRSKAVGILTIFRKLLKYSVPVMLRFFHVNDGMYAMFMW